MSVKIDSPLEQQIRRLGKVKEMCSHYNREKGDEMGRDVLENPCFITPFWRSLNNLLLVIKVAQQNFVEVKPHKRPLLLVSSGLGEYSFGGACEKSASVLLMFAEYFTNHS
ncbi:hypothetical protein Tco_0490302 [Tanacetum coccineum]